MSLCRVKTLCIENKNNDTESKKLLLEVLTDPFFIDIKYYIIKI